MGCSNTLKNCNQKSCVRYFNTNVQPLVAGETLTLTIAGSRAVDTGISIEVEPQDYVVLKNGLYHITADVIIEGEAVGNATLAVYKDGVAMPCTFRTIRVPLANDVEVHTETEFVINECCRNNGHTFTFVITADDTAAGNIVHFCSGILKLA